MRRYALRPRRRADRRLRVLQRTVGALAVAALTGGLAVASTVTGTAAAWTDGASAQTASTAGGLTITLDGFAALGDTFTVDRIARTGSMTIQNTGTIGGTATATVTVPNDSTASRTMAAATRVLVWPAASTAACTAEAVPTNAQSGTWAQFPAIVASLDPTRTDIRCIRSRVTGSSLATAASFRPTVTGTIAYGSSAWTATTTQASTNPFATTGSTTAYGSYADRVVTDGAAHYWPLGETANQVAFDWVGTDDVTMTGTSRDTAGAIVGSSGRATTFRSTACGAAQNLETAPSEFTLEAWIKTSTTTGGKIIGWGNSNSASAKSSRYDRHLYMDNAGIVRFGVYPGATRTVDSPTALNDGAWHHVVGTLSASGMALYVDGALVASRTDATAGEDFRGYWRIGCDTTWAGDDYFDGVIDEVAVYPRALDAGTARAHYRVGLDAVDAAFTASASQLRYTFDASATDAANGVKTFAWDFGDGTTATGAVVSKRYTSTGDRTVTLTVTSNNGTTRSVSHVVHVTDPAATQPAAPTASQLSSSKATLSWTAVSDGADGSGTTGYRVLRDNAVIATVTGTTYTDTGLTKDHAYSYSIAALDAAGNVSAASPATTVRTHPFSNRYVRIKSVHTGLCLNVGSSANNTPLTQTTCGRSNAVTGAQTGQLFHFIQVANGSYELAPAIATGQRLDVYGRGTAAGDVITSWTAANQNNQWFLPVLKPSTTNVYRLTIPYNGLCFDIPGGTSSQTTQLNQYTCNGQAWQDWSFEDSTLTY